MKKACIYMTFENIKKNFHLPEDALLKHINIDNDTGEIEVLFYTNTEEFHAVSVNQNDVVTRVLV